MYVLTVITCLCHVTLLNSDSSIELDLRLVQICQDSFVLFAAYSLAMESTFWFTSETGYLHIGLIGMSIVEFSRDSFEVGNIWREVHRELKLEELWMEEELKKEKRTLKTSIMQFLNELAWNYQ